MKSERINEAIKHAIDALMMYAVFFHGSEDPVPDAALAQVAVVRCQHESMQQCLVSLARRGWSRAHITLCDMAAFLTEIGDPLPLWLQEYIVLDAIGSRPGKRGADPWKNV